MSVCPQLLWHLERLENAEQQSCCIFCVSQPIRGADQYNNSAFVQVQQTEKGPCVHALVSFNLCKHTAACRGSDCRVLLLFALMWGICIAPVQPDLPTPLRVGCTHGYTVLTRRSWHRQTRDTSIKIRKKMTLTGNWTPEVGGKLVSKFT